MKRARPVVAIDGPVGAGKSTVARALAQALGFSYLNTGAMYRAVAVAARAAGVGPDALEGAGAGWARSAPSGTERALPDRLATGAGSVAPTTVGATDPAQRASVPEGAGEARGRGNAPALASAAQRAEPAAPALEEHLEKIFATLSITFNGERVMLAGHDISDAITAPEIGDLASRLSALALVRDHMRTLQRAAGEAGGVVMEGRDIGTVIFPDAEVKFFLIAEPAVRAARRYAELARKGVATTLEQVAAQLAERDRRDAERALAPLKPAADAIVIDSTGLDVAAVVKAMKSRVEAVSHIR